MKKVKIAGHSMPLSAWLFSLGGVAIAALAVHVYLDMPRRQCAACVIVAVSALFAGMVRNSCE